MHGTGCDEARSQYALHTLNYALSNPEFLDAASCMVLAVMKLGASMHFVL